MPVIHDITLSWDTREVLRREGFRRRSSRPEIATMTEKLLSEMSELRLLEPAAASVKPALIEFLRKKEIKPG